MSESLIERKRFGPYQLEVWTHGIQVNLIARNYEAISPKVAANSLRSMADWLEKSHILSFRGATKEKSNG